MSVCTRTGHGYASPGHGYRRAGHAERLIVEALHGDGVPWAPQIPIMISLAVIVGTLTIITVASLIRARRTREPSGDAVRI